MKTLVTSLALIFTITLFSQIEDPVKWNTSVKKISDTEYELLASTTIEEGWHLYSQTVPDDGPIPTTFTFQSNKNYLRKGNTKEEVGHTVDDKVFNMKIKFFKRNDLKRGKGNELFMRVTVKNAVGRNKFVIYECGRPSLVVPGSKIAKLRTYYTSLK